SFPNKWILNHLSPSSQDVILRMGKNEWLGKYLYHNIRNNGGLTGGWKYFALDNNLEEFDVCLFKPAGHMHDLLILEMSIFRVVEEITPLTAVNSPGKKRGVKRTPPGKKRGVKRTLTNGVQTELESIEGV
ncbi:B3 domain-containing protein, partial [Trifolium medium]|nr:B3 domain-containing protein [Trifolium medium]